MIRALASFLVRLGVPAAALSGLFAGLAPAQTPPVHLVADLLLGADAASANPGGGVELNGRLLFFARLGNSAQFQVCITDGTASGTSIVAWIGGTPTRATRVGNYVVFGSQPAAGDGEVWSTDGTAAGTRRILQGYTVDTVPDRWHGGPWITFVGKRGSRTYLFHTNGDTTSGPVGGLGSPRDLVAVAWRDSGQMHYLTFCHAFASGFGRALWAAQSTGLAPLTVSVAGVPTSNVPGNLTGVSAFADANGLFVAVAGTTAATGSEVFRYRRWPSTTNYVLQPLFQVASGAASAEPRHLVARGGELVFSANHGTGRELWRMPFTTGLVSVLNVEPSLAGSDPQDLVVLPSATGGVSPDIVFTATTAALGRELWRYDGATVGWLADVMPGIASSNPQVLGFADGRIWFAADDPLVGRELWRSDGTAVGTALAFDAVPGPGSSAPTACGVLDVGGTERLLYAAESPAGRELHGADAATQAPQLVRNLAGGPFSSSPRPLLALADGRAVVFTETSGELWVTDGTPGNTTLLATAAQLGGYVLRSPGQSIAFDDGTFLFVVANSVTFDSLSAVLWRSDGTPGGTQPTATLGTFESTGRPSGFVEFDSYVYFGATAFTGLFLPDSSFAVSTIWRTDRNGSMPVPVVGATQGLRKLRLWTVVGDRLFFNGERTDGSTGRELWVWQPPSAPTLVADIWPGPNGSDPVGLIAFRNRCYFIANDGIHGRELWSSIGPGSGTSLVADSNPGTADGAFPPLVSVGTLVYRGDDGVHGREPWRSNGVAAGTQMIADLQPGPGSSTPSNITAVHLNVFACTANDGVHGNELWRIDTVSGATLFDLRPGPAPSNPSSLTWSTRHLFFLADDGVHGREPWYASWIDFQTVGLVADMQPGAAGGANYLLASGPRVLLQANVGDGVTGTELYAIDASGSSTPIGTSCVQPFQVMELRSTAPILGQGLTYWVSGPGTGVPAMTLLSPRPATLGGLALPGVACPIWVDPNNYVVADMFTTPGNFTRTLPTPVLPTLLGATMRLQCVFDYPPMLATNGLDLVVGN